MSRIGIAILLLASVFNAPQSQNETLISEILRQNLVATEGMDRYAKVLEVVTKGTKFENHWQINQPVKSDYLNLFVLRAGIRSQPNLPAGINEMFGSCASLGEKNIVVCDDAYVNMFLEKHNVPDMLRGRPDLNAEWKRHQDAFLLWLLGHELGHVVKEHGAAHFGPDNLEKSVASSSIAHRRELEADSFLVDQVSKSPEISISLIRMMLDLLNAEIKSKIGSDIPVGVGILFDYTNKKVVKYMRLRTHPEYVVRITRMLQQLSNVQGNEGLKGIVDEFARLMREGT